MVSKKEFDKVIAECEELRSERDALTSLVADLKASSLDASVDLQKVLDRTVSELSAERALKDTLTKELEESRKELLDCKASCLELEAEIPRLRASVVSQTKIANDSKDSEVKVVQALQLQTAELDKVLRSQVQLYVPTCDCHVSPS